VILDWQDGRVFEAVGEAGKVVQIDASPEHGGRDAGTEPVELLLMSLAGCSGMDVISILEKKRQQVTGFQIEVDGARQEEHPRVYREITVTYLVTGHSVDPAAVARAIELSTTKYCPVFAMLGPTVKMVTRFEVHEADSTASPGRAVLMEAR
jgi:putative redox protein